MYKKRVPFQDVRRVECVRLSEDGVRLCIDADTMTRTEQSSTMNQVGQHAVNGTRLYEY